MSLCVCGHAYYTEHAQTDEHLVCLECSCQEYRKAADVSQSTAVLSAGGSPEGLAREKVSRPVNEAAERLRAALEEAYGPNPDADRAIDAALATERRNTVERIRADLSAAPALDVETIVRIMDLSLEAPGDGQDEAAEWILARLSEKSDD